MNQRFLMKYIFNASGLMKHLPPISNFEKSHFMTVDLKYHVRFDHSLNLNVHLLVKPLYVGKKKKELYIAAW